MRTLKGMACGLLLLAVCSGILLVSDWRRRMQPAAEIPAVSIFQFSSRNVLDESVRGCFDGLADRGYRDGQTLRARIYNAESDLPTANAIARAILEDGCRLVVTFSTPALQVVAGANQAGKLIHLFGTVTDPYLAGVGLSRAHPGQRPPHLAGIGTFQPVREVWRLAHRTNPRLKSAGVVWCTAETCSEACTALAREAAADLEVTLLEMPVSASTEISDAVRALLNRGVEAIWIGGDNIVEMAAPNVIELALQAGVPVFANAPDHAAHGALLALGADYYQVGRTVGNLAADVMEGRSPAAIPVENVVPPLLWINTNILARLRDPDRWRPPPEILAQAARIFGPAGEPAAPDRARGRRSAAAGDTPATPAPRAQAVPYRVGLVYFGPDPFVDNGIAGLKDGLRREGLQEGAEVEFLVRHAQSDISQIPQVIQQMDGAGLDLLVPMTTPCLTAAISGARRTPIVFTLVYDPIAAGAGTDFTNHLPRLTGIGSFPPLPETMALIRRLAPQAATVGTLYNPAEINSSRAVAAGKILLQAQGLALEAVAVAASAELHTATLALVQRGVDAIWITGDNTAISGFSAIAKAARDQRLPLICNDLDMLAEGALAAVGFNPYDSGFAAAAPAAQVLRGAAPAAIPIRNVAIRQVALQPEPARRLGLRLDDALLAGADILAGPPVKPWKISLLQQVDTPAVEESRTGILAGLAAAGLREGRDYSLAIRNAQGDLSLLPGLVDAGLAAGADMFITITTPALQTVLKLQDKIGPRPVIFALSLDPLLIGDSGSHTNHRANVTGVFDRSPFEDMLQILRAVMPSARRIGTLYAPAEINSVVFRDELARVAAGAGLELTATPVSAAGEAADAAAALAQQKIDAICQINDNLNNAAFPALAAAARRARLPVFAFSSGLADMGAALTLANDHAAGGQEAAALAARVMRGQSPASLPYRPVQRKRLTINLDAAAAAGLTIPTAIIRRADRVIGAAGRPTVEAR